MSGIEDINNSVDMVAGERRTCANWFPYCGRDAVGDSAYCGSHQRY